MRGDLELSCLNHELYGASSSSATASNEQKSSPLVLSGHHSSPLLKLVHIDM